MNMGRGIASMGKTQGGMRAVGSGIASMEKQADASWWLSGGIDPAAVAGVWQPKGAASLDASYLSLAGDEGYADIDPAIVGGVAPTWDAVNGWKFLSASAQYLTIPYSAPSGTYLSAIIRMSNIIPNTGKAFSAANSGDFHVYPRFIDNRAYFRGYSLSGGTSVGFSGTSGIFCLTAGGGYIDAIPVTPYSTRAIAINGLNVGRNENTTSTFWTGYIQAIAVYNTTLTPTQVGLLSTAMAAL